ncbi:hypothetical protein IFM89_018197 [Coptis chinensis]|uniref:Uncharacterized protein n=1 Tax=Coptis chinensis TaxID=261450 RepID=A0A835I363_9MAGN|nr:hypothetical protein IFM89_018197 [Coptis chinensis]
MGYLRLEAENLAKERDGWFDFEASRNLKRKRDGKKKGIVKRSVVDREYFTDDDDSDTQVVRKRTRVMETSGDPEMRATFRIDEILHSPKRRESGGVEKKGDYYVIDEDLEERSIPSRKTRSMSEAEVGDGSCARGKGSTKGFADLIDPDYKAFLEMFSYVNGEFDAEFWEKDLDFDGKNLVEEDDNCDYKSSVEDDVDPEYKVFLDNVREDGDSCVFEMEKEDGVVVVVKYFEDHKKKVDDKKKDGNKKKDGDKDSDDILCKERRGNIDTRVKPKAEPFDDAFEKRDRRPVQKSRLKTRYRLLSCCKPEDISRSDESYRNFLDHLWVKGYSMSYEDEDGIVKYEPDSGMVTDSEESEDRVMPYNNTTKFTSRTNPTTCEIAMSDDDSDSVQILGDTNTKFDEQTKIRKKLKKLLLKPVDDKEFTEKLEAARLRKPLERIKQMRGRSVTYQTDKMCKSYLDLHPDLAELLRAAERKFDRKRALALLRCLFFYYENVSHRGSFVPWRTPAPWLHDKICCCDDSLTCPLKVKSSQGKKPR